MANHLCSFFFVPFFPVSCFVALRSYRQRHGDKLNLLQCTVVVHIINALSPGRCCCSVLFPGMTRRCEASVQNGTVSKFTDIPCSRPSTDQVPSLTCRQAEGQSVPRQWNGTSVRDSSNPCSRQRDTTGHNLKYNYQLPRIDVSL